MATQGDKTSNFAGLDENFLTCEICAELYKRPRILLCHHTFCQECLEQWAEANKDKELTCPNCRQPWQVPIGGVEKLSANYYVNSLIDFVVESRKVKKESRGSSPETCESCESKAATSACLECAQLICDDCAKVHKRMKSSVGHQIVSVENYRANRDSQPAKLKPSECDRHSGIQLKYFCQTCSVPTCLECTIIEHPVPEHKHVYLGEAAREGRVSINTTLKEVQSKLEYYDAKETNIREVRKELTNFKDKTSLEIDMHTEKLVKKIQENGKEMKRKVDEIYAAKVKVLDSQLDRMELATGQVKSSLEYSKSLVELGTDAGLMSVHKQTQEMLEGLLSEEIQVEPQVNHHLQYSANPAFATGQQGSVADNKAVACYSVVKYIQSYIILKNKSLIQLVSNDMHGNEVRQGGAEVMAVVKTENGERVYGEVIDNDNGTYDISFTPTKPGTHWLSVSLLGQPVKDSPMKISTLPLQTTKVIGGGKGEEPGQFNRPSGVAVSKIGDIYVADNDNSRIQVFDSQGKYQRHFTVACEGKKVMPWGVAFTRENHLVVTDVNRVCVCDAEGNLLRQFGKGELKDPRGVAVSRDGHIHVTDWEGHCVKSFTPEGVLFKTIGQRGVQPGQFNLPHSVAVNSKGQIIVSDYHNQRVQVFDSSGAFLFTCERKGEGEGELKNPCGVTVDQHGRILVCYRDNNRIAMFNSEGNYIGPVSDSRKEVNGPYAITTLPCHPPQFIVTEESTNRIVQINS